MRKIYKHTIFIPDYGSYPGYVVVSKITLRFIKPQGYCKDETNDDLETHYLTLRS